MAISDSMEELMSRFWSCEEVGTGNIYSPEETRCEDQYARSVSRAANGRYTVGLPKNEQTWAQLGESRTMATRRLLGLERRLTQDAALRKQYQDFMMEYLELGHMKKVEAGPANDSPRCFLPHHPVVREESTTTKNAAGDGCIGCGKMFRQIDMAPEDSPYQSILYRFNPEEEIATYELTTVTYGTKPAPFLATRTLKQLAQDEQQRFPLAAQALETDVYMDDVISGADDVATATELRAQLDSLLGSGGFKLRKWASNEPSVLRGVARENLALPDEIDWDQEASVNTLGLKWLPKTDCFRFKFKNPAVTPGQPLTKQLILSIIATFFDPLGLLGASLVLLKMFMQKLWTLQRVDGTRYDWKDPLPPTVGEEWRKLSQHLGVLNNIRIPRCTVIKGAVDIQIHCYTDASEKAYGACVYIRSKNVERKLARRLLTSKSKVAPLKQQPLPRLELNGSDLGADLVEWVIRVFGKRFPVFFWTDSTCVLLWLKKPPSYWHTYVGNRVARIQRITEELDAVWNHIPGVSNPADLISRGVPPEELEGNEMWEEGPDWDDEEPSSWPAQPDLSGEEAPERRRVVVACVATVEFIDILLSRFSSYISLIRAVALARRFTRRFNKEAKQTYGYVTLKELREAEGVIVRLVQRTTFAEEIEDLLAEKSVSAHSRLRWFNPHIDEAGVLRVGGRLQHSKEPPGRKHPMVLPAKHRFTELLFKYYHVLLLHGGPQLVLTSVRAKYWPLGGKDLVRLVIHKCKKCYLAKPTSIQQQMGNLPKARVTVSRPFSQTGVDYFGPVYVKAGRGRQPTKAYVALFVCMATKAVHMELVTDLSTECFLQALRRFISRRNRPTDIYSDNGTNFVGAKNVLEQLLKQLKDVSHHEKIARVCELEGIRWHFNPPSAPHFGGLWEAAVRSAKHHLLRVLGENSASFEDYNTLLTQVEACMNSRPLTALSNDPTDLEPLTPGHFLTGASLQALPEPDYSHIPGNRLNRWQMVQQQTQNFWKRWRSEYLTQLQSRTKNWQHPKKVEVGKLVVIVDNNQPPMRWKMGRIHELHPGEDGVVRVVTVKTATNLLQRPVAKLCILPSQEEDEEESSAQPEATAVEE
ncbi:uncharacterized protein LOC119766449 [Culex quinquefasciatus]|uniref:uncharacterized protein LOC119766449 n=1 Tax=Culex quinquefasciatus TaxID=7176 RepID=UPI0018E2B9A8|nr:uncharacterized protein LOC119766449 [Culex quinquefasciatus]